MSLKKFIKENLKGILFSCGILVFINIYFWALNLLEDRMSEIYYLDVLLIFIYIVAFII